MSEIKIKLQLEWVDRMSHPEFHGWPLSPQLVNTVTITPAMCFHARLSFQDAEIIKKICAGNVHGFSLHSFLQALQELAP